MDPEDFDIEFRRWLRKKYLPELVRTGEPGDFGRRFRAGDEAAPAVQISPVASPSGDLVAAFSTVRDDVDVVLFDARKRTFLRALTKSPTNKYLYLAAQEFTSDGRWAATSPFPRTPTTSRSSPSATADATSCCSTSSMAASIGSFDAHGRTQIGLAWSPDGKHIAFSANRNGQFDIFEVDVASGEITNVTNDAIYDGAPTYSPDGRRWSSARCSVNGRTSSASSSRRRPSATS
jgi:Tol biopolymer transport system component